MNKKTIIIGASILAISIIGFVLIKRNKSLKSNTVNDDNINHDKDEQNGNNSQSNTPNNSQSNIPNRTAKINTNNRLDNKLKDIAKCGKYFSVWSKYKNKFVRIGNTVFYCFGDGLLIHFSKHESSQGLSNEQIWNQSLLIPESEVKFFYESTFRPNWKLRRSNIVPLAPKVMVQSNPANLDNSQLMQILVCSQSINNY